MTGEPECLGAGGMRALQAERVENTRLRKELRDTKKQLHDKDLMLHNLRAAVVSATNHLIDVAEEAGAQRK